MVRQEQGEEIAQDVGPGNGLTKLLQESFEILFRRLLTQKTALVMKRAGPADGCCGELKVGLGLGHPPGRRLFHKGPSPWP